MKNPKRAISGFILLLAIVVGAYFWWQQRIAAPESAALPVAASTPAPAPIEIMRPAAEAAIQHPLATVEPAESLPVLNESDAAWAQAFSALIDNKAWRSYFINTELIRRIVATVDNLPREEAPVNRWPVRPVGSWLKTEKHDGVILLAPSNAQRYAGHIKLVQSIDARLLASIYQRFYPLFQQAYVDLGFPHGYFNDRLIVMIDNLLATPEPTQPLQLLSTKVFYDFADPDLQQRSSGQKIMLRIGLENARIVKTKLREFRRAVASPNTAQ